MNTIPALKTQQLKIWKSLRVGMPSITSQRGLLPTLAKKKPLGMLADPFGANARSKKNIPVGFRILLGISCPMNGCQRMSAKLSCPVSPLLLQISSHPPSVNPRTTCECDIALSYTDIYRRIENRRKRPFLKRQFESHPVRQFSQRVYADLRCEIISRA